MVVHFFTLGKLFNIAFRDNFLAHQPTVIKLRKDSLLVARVYFKSYVEDMNQHDHGTLSDMTC